MQERQENQGIPDASASTNEHHKESDGSEEKSEVDAGADED